MKRPSLLLIVIAPVFILGTSTLKPSTTAVIINQERILNDALVRGDWRTLSRLETDDNAYTNTDGSVDTKSTQVSSLRAGDMRFTSIVLENVVVQDLGCAAVARGTLIEKGTYKKTDIGGSYRFTDVWVWRDSRWQLVAGQEVSIPR